MAMLVLLAASGSLALQLPGVVVIQGLHVLLEHVVVVVAQGTMTKVRERALSLAFLFTCLLVWVVVVGPVLQGEVMPALFAGVEVSVHQKCLSVMTVVVIIAVIHSNHLLPVRTRVGIVEVLQALEIHYSLGSRSEEGRRISSASFPHRLPILVCHEPSQPSYNKNSVT